MCKNYMQKYVPIYGFHLSYMRENDYNFLDLNMKWIYQHIHALKTLRFSFKKSFWLF
jgi:hypothetical protein